MIELIDTEIVIRWYTQHALRPYINLELIIGILLNFNLYIKELNSLTYSVYLKINLLSLLYLLILKLGNCLLFVLLHLAITH